MATLPTNDGTAGSINSSSTTNAQQKLNFANLVQFVKDLFGTDSANKATALSTIGAAASGATATLPR